MLLRLCVALLLLPFLVDIEAQAAQFTTPGQYFRCSFPQISDSANRRQHAYLQQLLASESGSGNIDARIATTNATSIGINVWFHIFRSGDSQGKGDVPDDLLSAQVVQLNRFYNKHGFKFRLGGTTRTTSAMLAWETIGHGGRREYPAKSKTRKGSWNTLNIWVLQSLVDPARDNPGDYVAGFARFPYDPATLGQFLNQFTPVLALDGITIAQSEMFRNASGKLTTTVPHETGHWLGLFHTFQGGCRQPGDGVADTPYEANPGFGCTPRNTCVTKPGYDPIHNLMDYSSDDCQRGFTSGQGDRMRRIWGLFRDPTTRRPHRYISEQMVYKYVLD